MAADTASFKIKQITEGAMTTL